MVFRKADFKGSWYSGSRKELLEALERYFNNKSFGPGETPKTLGLESRTIIGGVSPHAGHQYSGSCAAFTYLNLFKEKIPDTIIILGTDHKGYRNIALFEEGEWETPLGNLMVDNELSNKILGNSKTIISDNSAFLIGEWNIEIQLPFIKYCAGENDVKILPIKIKRNAKIQELDELSNNIANSIKDLGKDIVIVASSDMSHYNVFNEEQIKTLKEIDQAVIEQFLNFNAENILNPENFINREMYNKFGLEERGPSICGRQTITTLILIGIKLNTTKARLLKYYTSKDISPGGHPWTVGYFSGIVVK